ncbi:MAG: di-trans,poly-cis-decaprenylcistransferase [Acidobacteriaceae bacterium]|nr:di-trans,poly-cis-decaprenylcistransferase [Acidobacteriaceae bacterium]
MQSNNISSNFTSQSDPDSSLKVAIIMDGNGRWAVRRGLPRVAGHRAGVAAVRRTIEHAPLAGIGQLTLYAFSSDNWRRPPMEVESIFWLLRTYLRLEAERLRQSGVRVVVIGRRDRIPRPLLKEIIHAESVTAACTRLHLRIAIDYSSRESIARTASALLSRCDSLRPEQLVAALTSETGELDLLIRTGGEQRLSDFLLWESAYTELYFTGRMWPDFGADDLEAALADFRGRQRRFGGVPAPEPANETTQLVGGAL